MKPFFRVLPFLLTISTAAAESIRVSVGNTGCRSKQLTVQRFWQKIPGVRSVIILPRRTGESTPNQCDFIVTTKGAAPDRTTLTRAMGKRADRHPVLKITRPPPPDLPAPSPLAPSSAEARRD